MAPRVVASTEAPTLSEHCRPAFARLAPASRLRAKFIANISLRLVMVYISPIAAALSLELGGAMTAPADAGEPSARRSRCCGALA